MFLVTSLNILGDCFALHVLARGQRSVGTLRSYEYSTIARCLLLCSVGMIWSPGKMVVLMGRSREKPYLTGKKIVLVKRWKKEKHIFHLLLMPQIIFFFHCHSFVSVCCTGSLHIYFHLFFCELLRVVSCWVQSCQLSNCHVKNHCIASSVV